MKKALVAIALVATTITAFASCPIGTMYRCVPTASGKLMCGCF